MLQDRVVKALEGSEVVQKAVAADAKKRTAERQTRIDDLARLDAAREKEAPALRRKAEEAKAAALRADQALLKANREAASAWHDGIKASLGYDAARDEIMRDLRAWAEPQIATFVQNMRLEEAKARKAFRYVLDLGEKNPVTGARGAIGWTNNQPSIEKRIEAIRAAIAEAESLYVVADQARVCARLEELRKGLPPIAIV